MRLILINKPFHLISAFKARAGQRTLADLLHAPRCRTAGRLDFDSEGLLLLTDDGALQARLSHPQFKVPKTYFAQVEGTPGDEALEQLRAGISLADGPTRPACISRAAEPPWLWPRQPPIRYRAAIPTTWLEVELREGRNRQVRRMTAAVGHPTLRLIRWAVGPLTLSGLRPGEWRDATRTELEAVRRDTVDPPTPASRGSVRSGLARSKRRAPHLSLQRKKLR